MKTREDYERALSVIGKVVKRWDPYSLIEGGAPQDEFDSEIAQLATYIRKIRTPDDAVKAVSEVFSRAFSHEDFSPRKCSRVGQDLFNRLVKGGFVEPYN